MTSSFNTTPSWEGQRIPRKRNRSTSAIKTNNNSNDLNEPIPGTSTLHAMTYDDRRTPNDCTTLPFSPSKQIFQHFPSWFSLTNSDASTVSDPQPPKKRRKGVAGAILSTALDAALFTSAIGYAAYNFWCGKGLEEEEANRLPLKSRHSRSSIPIQSLLSSPPPPYEPPEQIPEQVRIARTTRKPMSTRSVPSHRLYSTRSVQPSSTPTDPINFILHSNSTPSTNHSFHLKEETESINGPSSTYTPTASSEAIVSNEMEDEEYEEEDEELKAFKAQIQGLIKEGREALASRPSIPTSIAQSSSSSSLHPSPSSKIVHRYRQHTTNSHLQTVVTSTDKYIQSVPQLDENVQLLQRALEKAALPSHSNWWER